MQRQSALENILGCVGKESGSDLMLARGENGGFLSIGAEWT
jgi:hypothetical protein